MEEKIKGIFNTILIFLFEHPLRVLVIWFLIIISSLILSFIFKLVVPPFVSSFVGDLSAALTIVVIFNVIYPSYKEWKDKNRNMNKIITGNIKKDERFKKQRSWIFGYFADPPFKSEHFEIKLAEHPKGEKKREIAKNEVASTFTTLISGKFLIIFYNKEGGVKREALLEKPGDYVFYQPGVFHDWEVKEDSVTLTVRLPSIENDQKVLKEVKK